MTVDESIAAIIPETMARINSKELADAFIAEQLDLIRKQVGTKKVLLALRQRGFIRRRSASD